MFTYHPSPVVSRVLAVATAICAVGFLTVPTPVHAGPMLPLAPACQYGFIGDLGEFKFAQSNGAHVTLLTDGPYDAVGVARATRTGGSGDEEMAGIVKGGLSGNQLDFVITWNNGPIGKYNGTVDDAGFVHGTTFDVVDPESRATWDSTTRLGCVTPPAAPAPVPVPAPVPAPAPSTAVVSAIANGPATLQTGLSGTYVVTVSNSGGVRAPVELFIIFSGKLEQMGQIRTQGGFDCALQPPAAGITAALRCTGPQVEPGAKFDIVVQGRGSAPGAGKLLAKIGDNVNQKDVTIT